MSKGFWVTALAAAATACASADGVEGTTDDAAGVVPDAEPADLDAAPPDAPELEEDAAPIDAALIDAMPIDAMPIDATPIDAMCSPTWHELLGNAGFESGVAPWTQTSTIIRDAGGMPFSPHSGTYAALFGASNNANDVLVQTVSVPAGATQLRVRAYTCFVTEDPIEDTDTFKVTLETPGGAVLDTLLDVTNSDVAPICFWSQQTWNAPTSHAGETIVLRMNGRTNLAFLTRFAVDTMALEWHGCP